jgi:hypothetical protein
MAGKPREIRWSWAYSSTRCPHCSAALPKGMQYPTCTGCGRVLDRALLDLRNGYMAVDGRVTIAELIEHMRQVAPGVSLDEINVNWATVVWSRPGTDEEIADRRQAEALWEARHEKWERETLARLTEKYKVR